MIFITLAHVEVWLLFNGLLALVRLESQVVLKIIGKIIIFSNDFLHLGCCRIMCFCSRSPNLQLKFKDPFMAVCLVAWPLNESEAGVDLVLIETLLLFY